MAALHYRELIAWQKAIDLVVEVYRLTDRFPRQEIYGLTSQVRRAAISVPSNIAEGQGRGVGAEFAHHLRISNGSRQEAETQIIVAERLGYITAADSAAVLALAEETGRITAGLLRSITGT